MHQPAHGLRVRRRKALKGRRCKALATRTNVLSHPADLTLTHARLSTRYLPNVLRSKPIITDLVSPDFLKWNMTINPENSTPLMSYPAGG